MPILAPSHQPTALPSVETTNTRSFFTRSGTCVRSRAAQRPLVD
jgi:hypothetical protein